MCTKGICFWVLIDTVNQPLLTLDQLLIDISIDTWMTLEQFFDWHLIDSQSFVGWVSTDSWIDWHLMATLDWLLTEMLSRYWLSSNWDVNRLSIKILIKYWLRFQSSNDWHVNRGSIKGINWCSTTDAFRTCDPKILVKNLWKLSPRICRILTWLMKVFKEFAQRCYQLSFAYFK